MTTTTTRDLGLAPAIAELHRVFDAVNERFYNGDLPSPVITIQSQGRKKGVLGWCTTWEAWQRVKESGEETEGKFEISLTAEYMNRPVIEILETLVHEIAHLANAHYGIHDCSGTQYHNRKFKEQAEYLMLKVSQVARKGWAHTELTPELAEWLESLHVDESAFEFARGELPARKKAPTKMKLWECGCTKIRAAVEIDAICKKCGQPFERKGD